MKIFFQILLLFPVFAFGQPEIQAFGDYSHKVNDGNHSNAFNLNRSYLGYSIPFTDKFKIRSVVDFSDPNVFKYGYIQFKSDKFLVMAGQFENLNLKEWDKRYLLPSFQQKYSFASDRFLGFYGQFSHKWLSIDVQGSKLNYGGSLMAAIGNFSLRGHADNHLYSGNLKFKNSRLTTSIEYSGTNDNHLKLSGYSFYAVYNLNNYLSLIIRNDNLNSVNNGINDRNSESTGQYPWNFKNDGELFFLGMEIKPLKWLRLSPNVSLWTPADGEPKESFIDFHDRHSNIYTFNLNAEIKI